MCRDGIGMQKDSSGMIIIIEHREMSTGLYVKHDYPQVIL
jgi:hypothetical protein